MNLDWQCRAFGQTPSRQIYGALALRSRVFVVEQQCLYLDLDGDDLDAQWVIGSLPDTSAVPDRVADDEADEMAAVAGVVATARILRPGSRFAEASIGRVCIAVAYRKRGLGRVLMDIAIGSARTLYPGQPIRISAQSHLKDFYASLGFEPVSGRYLEDGIEHLGMRLAGLSGPD